jgi:hypothetical protein
MINGDDILFLANLRFYEVWQQVIREFGFQLSVGKNYIHPHFVMVNSEAWWYSQGSLTHIPFFNVGLLTGQTKVSGRLEQRTAPLWDYYNLTMAGSSNRVRTHFRFLSLHKEDIKKLTQDGQFNLFIDRRFGGLGCTLWPEVEPYVHFTAFQRKFGHYLRSQVETIDGQISEARTALGIVLEERGTDQVQKYHHGHYALRQYVDQGSEARSLFTLVIGEDERLPKNLGISRPLLTARIPKEKTTKVVHPKRSLMRSFRTHQGTLFTSVGRLLSQERVYVETFTPISEL